ncbi:translation initiation factor IF-2, partial [Serratia fonticola]
MITNNERQDSQELVYKAVSDAISTGLRVALPGIIQSFDADAVTATIQPAVKVPVRQADGSV